MSKPLVLACLFVGLLGGSAAASAQERAALRDPDGHLVLQGGLGPAIGIANISDAQLKLDFEVLYMFGDHADGLGLGGAFQMSLIDYVTLQFGFEVRYTFILVEGFALSPLGIVGLGLFIPEGDTIAALNLGFGLEGRLSFGDGYLFVRPVLLDLFIEDDAALRYDLIVGGGVAL
jgi:hypothetical protein